MTDIPLLYKLGTLFNIYICSYFLSPFMITLYSISKNLTYDELMHPEHYPYLYMFFNNDQIIYKNKQDKGFIKNWKYFLKK